MFAGIRPWHEFSGQVYRRALCFRAEWQCLGPGPVCRHFLHSFPATIIIRSNPATLHRGRCQCLSLKGPESLHAKTDLTDASQSLQAAPIL